MGRNCVFVLKAGQEGCLQNREQQRPLQGIFGRENIVRMAAEEVDFGSSLGKDLRRENVERRLFPRGDKSVQHT